MSRCFVTESRVRSGDRVRPITRPLSLSGNPRFPSSAWRFAGLHPKMPGGPMRVQPSRAKRSTSEDG
jgi:hypothetical protein